MIRFGIRRALHEDTDALVNLYRGVQQWLAELGLDQWAKNSDAKTRAKLVPSIERGECYVAERDGKLIGMITVDTYADPEFWSPGDEVDHALYVHRMAVDRSESGSDVGGKLLDWAERIAASQGRKWLRLDAWRTNEKLHAYYRRHGFDAVRVVNLSHRGSGALFQRRVRESHPST